MIEERSGKVTLTIRVTTRIDFSPVERSRPITHADFIDNAIGSLPPEWERSFEDAGFEIAFPIDGEVHDDHRTGDLTL